MNAPAVAAITFRMYSTNPLCSCPTSASAARCPWSGVVTGGTSGPVSPGTGAMLAIVHIPRVEFNRVVPVQNFLHIRGLLPLFVVREVTRGRTLRVPGAVALRAVHLIIRQRALRRA